MLARYCCIMFGASAVLFLAIGCESANRYAPPPPAEVTVKIPTRRSVKTYLEYSGVLRAVASEELRARVKGFLKEKHFKGSEDVKKGDLLLVIDEPEFVAKLAQTNAKVAEAEANLKKAETSRAREIARAQVAIDEAGLILSQIEQTRQRSLRARNAAAEQDVDRADANQKKSKAQVDADKASLDQSISDYDVNILVAKANIASAKADFDRAKIDLGYCRILSPINGRISRSFVDPGNLVGDGQATLLATVLSDQEIYAYMSVSESDVLRFREMQAAGQLDDFRKVNMPLELGLANEKGFPHLGRIDYVDPGVDTATGTVQARGIFPNKDGKLVSGAFVRVRVPFETKNDAMLVPEEALGSDSQGRFVLVVNEDGVVERRNVVIGSQTDTDRIIESGLKATDRVVTLGLQKARPGQKVRAVSSVASTTSDKAAAAGTTDKP